MIAARIGHAVLEHQRRAHPDRHDQVIEPVRVGERQDAEDAVVLADAEVLHDRAATKCMLRCRKATPFGTPVDPDV